MDTLTIGIKVGIFGPVWDNNLPSLFKSHIMSSIDLKGGSDIKVILQNSL